MMLSLNLTGVTLQLKRKKLWHRQFIVEPLWRMVQNNYKSWFTYRIRVKARVLFAAIFLGFATRIGFRFGIQLGWTTDDCRTIGDFFPLAILARVLESWGHTTVITIQDLEPAGEHWKDLPPEYKGEITEVWENVCRKISPTSTVNQIQVIRPEGSLWFRPLLNPFRGSLGPILCDQLLAEAFKIGRFLCLSTEKFLIDELGADKTELEGLGIQDGFVGWHVRQNEHYARHRGLTEAEIVRDFLWLARLHRKPIVLFSSRAGLDRVRQIVENHKKIPASLKNLLMTHEQDFLTAMKLALSADFYAQFWGGGLAIPVIYSKTPYLIIEQKSWPIHPTPWKTNDQKAISSDGVRAGLGDFF